MAFMGLGQIGEGFRQPPVRHRQIDGPTPVLVGQDALLSAAFGHPALVEQAGLKSAAHRVVVFAVQDPSDGAAGPSPVIGIGGCVIPVRC